MWVFLSEALKVIGTGVLIAFLVVAYLLAAGCSNEGAGFSNTGRQAAKACVERDSRGNERWRSC